VNRSLIFAALTWTTLAPAAAWCADHATAPRNQVVSGREIEDALAAKPRTRGLTRGLVIKGAEEKKEVIDLNIPFELNSATLQPQAVAQLEQLDTALKSAALGRSRFMIAGHTDGRGNAEYNRQLSIRRAETVKQYLVAHGVAARRLEASGFGMDRLLMPEDPQNGANRRVEITNLGEAP
jgi:outer membrane protein OmpA-like peptidoglycan-associated protein